MSRTVSKQVICVFGDSIARGEGDVLGGWVSRLDVSLKGKVVIHNFGVSGAVSADTMTLLEKKVRIQKPDVIIIAIGCNAASVAIQTALITQSYSRMFSFV